MRLSDCLGIGPGVTAVIGGGGKTTLISTLAEELREEGTVIVCTSTHIRIPGRYPLVTGGGDELAEALRIHGAVCAGTPEVVAACPESHTGRFLRDMLGLPKKAEA